jgi:trafficking protein particle complex subunit 11
MEAFPEDYVAHNLPLILLSGIGHDEKPASDRTESSRSLLQEGGFRIRTDLPPVRSKPAEDLLQAFLSFDSTKGGVNGQNASARDSPWAFKIKRVGRVG